MKKYEINFYIFVIRVKKDQVKIMVKTLNWIEVFLFDSSIILDQRLAYWTRNWICMFYIGLNFPKELQQYQRMKFLALRDFFLCFNRIAMPKFLQPDLKHLCSFLIKPILFHSISSKAQVRPNDRIAISLHLDPL
ncbi:hypothetical protein BpHYR1_015081 [Brachionus plicatilis]|uniref:Uncharacterized protein n=1 Tax=Brachionus plicatilis TaxID=10195 RepID=A0A3M7QBT0_BRAPC|nr:hypothetical protein BpHYR1_015081 [Brachionus plicatilis]